MSEGSYIRGAGAGPVDGRRIAWLAAIVTVALLAAATGFVAVSTAADRSTADRLRASGVPVRVTVTGCTGITSGVGMGVEYFDCRGRYRVGGTEAEAPIRGERSQHRPGDVLAGVVVPGDPATLTLAGAVGRGGSSPAVAIVLGVVTVVAAAFLVGWRARTRRRPQRGAPDRSPTGSGSAEPSSEVV